MTQGTDRAQAHPGVGTEVSEAERPGTRGRTWPAGGGAMGARFRAHDWAATALGPVEQWPRSLRGLVDLMLAARQPAYIAWGADLTSLYNDGYIPILGAKGPHALGAPFPRLFAEIWDECQPIVAATMAGETQHFVDCPVALAGREGRALSWFTFSWTPVLDDSGAVAGFYCAATETTERILAEQALRERHEATLRATEQRFEYAVNATRDIVWDIDLVADQVWWSDAMERQLGYAPESRGPDLAWCISHVHPDDRDRVVAGLWRAAEGAGDLWSDEFRYRRADGAYAHIDDRGFIVRDGQGRAVRMIGAMQDVTERKRAEEQLRDSEARLRGFVENSADVLWIVDAEGRGIEYLSPSYERIWGESRERVMRDFGRWGELVLPEDHAGASRAMPRLLAGEALVIEDYRIVRPSDGEVRWIRDTGFPIRDSDGLVRRVGGIAQDITEIRRAEAALRESEAHLRLVTEHIPQLVWTASGDSQWTWASPQWCAYTDLTAKASQGMGWLEAIHPEDRAATTAAWAAAESAGLLDVEHRLRSADGAYRWFHTRASPLAHGAGAGEVEWFGTSTDVHEMRRLRDQQEVLVAELQHRTRNLIAVVHAIVSQTMASTDTLAAFNAELGGRLDALARVQGLLSRAQREPITIGALLRMELNALGVEAGAAHGAAHGAAAARDRVALEGPEVFLRNSVVQTLALALHELATNARKYGALAAEPGRLRVTWQVHEAGDGTRHLVLEWVEEGARRLPPDRPAPGEYERDYRRGGYGRELIERALPYTLGAETRYEMGATGVRCTIGLPLDARRDP